jgi:hypothetical protein
MAGDMIFEMEPNWNTSYFYDINEAAKNGTISFSKEEVLTAKELVTERLKREDLETRSYKLYMIERAGTGVMPVYVIFDDDVKYLDGKSLDRTYFISNNEIASESVSNLPQPPQGIKRTR